jgi:hypothetical protein
VVHRPDRRPAAWRSGGLGLDPPPGARIVRSARRAHDAAVPDVTGGTTWRSGSRTRRRERSRGRSWRRPDQLVPSGTGRDGRRVTASPVEVDDRRRRLDGHARTCSTDRCSHPVYRVPTRRNGGDGPSGTPASAGGGSGRRTSAPPHVGGSPDRRSSASARTVTVAGGTGSQEVPVPRSAMPRRARKGARGIVACAGDHCGRRATGPGGAGASGRRTAPPPAERRRAAGQPLGAAASGVSQLPAPPPPRRVPPRGCAPGARRPGSSPRRSCRGPRSPMGGRRTSPGP